jgi:hypothetical protein
MSTDPVRLLTDSLVADLARSNPQTGWLLSLCIGAREAGGSFRSALRPPPPIRVPGQSAADPARAAEEAARRARAKSRRYCAANGLNRLGTLTYGGAGCHDPKQLRTDVGLFFRELRRLLGGKAFPYLWTAEWHKSGHGLHVHFAVGRFIKRSLIEQAWPHGFVHIKLLGDLPVGSGTVAEARQAARYLSKYVGKDFDAQRLRGLHRYEVAQGFQPKINAVWGRTRDEAIDIACRIMRHDPEVFWSSDEKKDWQGPPAVWMQWPG